MSVQRPGTDQPGAQQPGTGAPAGPGRKGRWAVAGVTAAALALGGGALAAQRAGVFGAQGSTPDTAVPRSTVAYLRIDTNPDAGQKVAAFRLFSKLPEVRDAAGDGKDWRRSVFDKAKEDTSCLKDKDFDRDVSPWLGDRAAMSAYLPADGQSLVPVLALAVTDEEKAKKGLPALMCGGDPTHNDVRWIDGYAIVTDKGKGDQTVAAIKAGSLHDNPSFAQDMSDLGSDGIASAWVDTPALARADLSGLKDEADRSSDLGGNQDLTGQQLETVRTSMKDAGRLSAALRLDADYVELAGIERGGRTTATSDKVELGTLPADTVAAVGVSGVQESLKKQWPDLMKQLDSVARSKGDDSAQTMISQVESSLGVSLPDDLGVLFGRQTLLAVADQDFRALSERNLPKVGLRSTTDAARAESVTNTLLDKVAEQQGVSSAFLPVRTGVEGQTFTLALDEDYRRQLAGSGGLHSDDGFTKAVGEGKGTGAFYLSLDRIEKYYLDQVPEDRREFVRAMRGIGMVTDQDGDGRGHFSLRLVAN